jgi:hypothetical protein
VCAGVCPRRAELPVRWRKPPCPESSRRWIQSEGAERSPGASPGGARHKQASPVPVTSTRVPMASGGFARDDLGRFGGLQALGVDSVQEGTRAKEEPRSGPLRRRAARYRRSSCPRMAIRGGDVPPRNPPQAEGVTLLAALPHCRNQELSGPCGSARPAGRPVEKRASGPGTICVPRDQEDGGRHVCTR